MSIPFSNYSSSWRAIRRSLWRRRESVAIHVFLGMHFPGHSYRNAHVASAYAKASARQAAPRHDEQNFFASLFILIFLTLAGSSLASDTALSPPKQSWGFNRLFGTFNRSALQRGFQVYKEVCSTCHSLKRVSYRNLSALGFNPEEVKAIAAQYEVTDGPNDDGQMFQRKALPSDPFVSPFANDKAARAANNGSLPPDLSLIVKARAGGADYIYALLTGYATPPPPLKEEQGRHYNPYFPGGFIGMPPPLTAGQVSYSDCTAASVEQMSRDVVEFLAWAAEPELEQRKQMGVKVLLYLLFMTVIFYLTYRKIWRGISGSGQ